MSYPLDSNGLRRDPQTIFAGVWYYEEQSGITVVTPERLILIPWRKLRASVGRKYKVKEGK